MHAVGVTEPATSTDSIQQFQSLEIKFPGSEKYRPSLENLIEYLKHFSGIFEGIRL
jgi:hypothetical protein